MLTAHQLGYAMFHRGKVPDYIPNNEREYFALTREQQQVVDGVYDARIDMCLTFEGRRERSTNPMTQYLFVYVPPGEAKWLTAEDHRIQMLKRGVDLSIPKAPRRKGREAIAIRSNAEGMSITWRGATLSLEGLKPDEISALFANAMQTRRTV